MMSTTFEGQRLQATFTFRIMEIVRRMKIPTIPRATEVPWGLSLAAGIIIAILGLNPHMSIFDPMNIPTGTPLSAKTKILEIGEIPVAMLEVSQMLVLAGDEEDGDSRQARPPGPGAPPPDSRVVIEDDSTSSEPGAIRGKVTDSAYPDQHNLEGAVVTVKNDKLLAAEGGKRSVTAEGFGEYVIDNLPPGEYIVTVTNPGYEQREERVTVLPRAEAFHDIRMYLKGTNVGPSEFVIASRRQMRVWRGVLDIDGNIHRIVLKLTSYPPYTATLDGLDQNLKDISVDNILFDGENLNFEIESINATFEGKVKERGSTVEGEWKQGGKPLPLTLYKRAQRRPEPRRPQDPEKPYPYKEEEILYRNRKAGVILAGTLTLPDSDGPFPAIILLSDYGVDDRDELQRGLGHRPFLVLADYLTRQGIAVLRTDDRGVGWSTGNQFESTFADLADDAVAGIEHLKSRKEINARQIGLIGHGVGGSVALIAATQSEDVAFVVLMAGIGLTGDELLLSRMILNDESRGKTQKEITKDKELHRRTFAVMKQEKDNDVAMQEIRDIIADVTVKFSETELSEEEIQAIRKSSGSAYFSKLNPYFRSFLTFDPGPALTKLKSPILAFDSENNQNTDAIEKALKAGRNKHYTIKVLPGINWQFQTIQPGVPMSEIEETISPIVLKLIGDWLLEHTK